MDLLNMEFSISSTSGFVRQFFKLWRKFSFKCLVQRVCMEAGKQESMAFIKAFSPSVPNIILVGSMKLALQMRQESLVSMVSTIPV